MIRPSEVLARFLGAVTIEERRQAYELYNCVSSLEVCRIAQSMGLRLDIGANSIWHHYWNLSR